MKKDKHPPYKNVVFVDSSTGLKFVCGTTATSEQKETIDGNEMDTIVTSISAVSHPYFVGGKQYVDTEGRVDRFKKKYQSIAKQPKPAAAPTPAKTTPKKTTAKKPEEKKKATKKTEPAKTETKKAKTPRTTTRAAKAKQEG